MSSCNVSYLICLLVMLHTWFVFLSCLTPRLSSCNAPYLVYKPGMGRCKKTDEVWDMTRRQIRYGALQEDRPRMRHYKKTYQVWGTTKRQDEVWDITRRQIRYGALQENRPGMRHYKKTNKVWGITRRQTRCETLQEDKPGMGHYKKTDEVW
jgi:hypothetical protein